MTARRKNKIDQELENEDLFDLPYFDRTDYLLKRFDERWQMYLVSSKRSVNLSLALLTFVHSCRVAL